MSSSIIPSVSEQYSGFDPRQIGDCALWFDGADTNTITGTSTVTNWRSKGSLSVSATNFTGSCTSGNTFNGLNYISIPAGTEMRFTAALNTQARSWFIVARLPSPLTSGKFVGIVNASGTSGQDSVYMTYTSSTLNSLAESPSGVAVNISADITSSTMASTFIASIVNSASTASNTITSNGTSQTLTKNLAASGYSTASLAYRIGTASYNTALDIMELILYYGDVTTAQRQQVEAYLAWKWSLTSNFPVTQIYKSVKPFTRPFQPTDIDSCKLWLDASDRTTFTLSGTTITQWRDKSGNSDRTSGGTYNATGTLGNSLSTMTISNTYIYTVNQIGISGASPQSYVMLVNTSNTANTGNMLHWQTAAAGNAYTGSIIMSISRDSVTVGINQVGFNIVMTGLTQTKTKMAISTHTGALMRLFESGTEAGSSATQTLNQTNGNLRIGIGTASMEVGEIMVYNKALSSSERQQIEGYLAKKWGLLANLPSTNSFKLYPPLSTLFTPRFYPSCNLWLDAADASTITYASGSTVNVSALNDKSPTGVNFTRIYSAGFEVTTANTLNGLPTLRFPNDPVDNNDTRTYFTSSVSLPMSASVNYVFFVMRFNPYVVEGTSTARGWGIIFPISISVAYGVQGGFKRSGTNWFLTYDTSFVGTAAAATTATFTTSSGPSVGTPLICMFGKTAQSQYVFSINGTYETKAGSNYAHAGGQPVRLGSYYQNQELCEMITYSGTALDRGDIQRIEGYLAWKWGLQANLPSTHSYYKSRP